MVKALGLAETVLSDRAQKQARLKHYRTRVISEEPAFRLLHVHGEMYTVPFPYVHYLFTQADEPRLRSWRLLSVYASPRHLTKQRFRKVSRPPLPNLYAYRPLYTPCQNGRSLLHSDPNRAIANFWSGNFNEDLSYITPVVTKIEQDSTSRKFSKGYMDRWEKYSLQEMLDMPWEQDIRL